MWFSKPDNGKDKSWTRNWEKYSRKQWLILKHKISAMDRKSIKCLNHSNERNYLWAKTDLFFSKSWNSNCHISRWEWELRMRVEEFLIKIHTWRGMGRIGDLGRGRTIQWIHQGSGARLFSTMEFNGRSGAEKGKLLWGLELVIQCNVFVVICFGCFHA